MHSVLLKSILIGILLVVSVIPLHAASDLVVTTVASPPASLTTGAKVSLPTTVTNQGNAASPKTTITYYLSPGSSKDNAWLLSSKRSVKVLAPGATYTAKAKVTVPSGIPSAPIIFSPVSMIRTRSVKTMRTTTVPRLLHW